MRISNDTPFAFLPLPSKVNPPQASVTLILKGTFDIVPDGICTPAAKQRKIDGDRPHLDDIGRSLAWASDLAPFKPHTDFFILGAFHQPGGAPAPEGRGGFSFGPLRKELAFLGSRLAVRAADRTWSVTPPEPFVSLPLRWEYSFGGLADRRNPMGLGIDPLAGPDGGHSVPLPRIEDPRALIRTIKDRPAPANFAPVPQTFLERRRKQGTRDQRWSVFRAPLPPRDYDPSYHNAAPADQQAGNYPVGDEELVLHNLHPTIPHLATRLPRIRPRAAILRNTAAGMTGEDVELNLDTVVALPDDNQLVLLWRGVVPQHQSFLPDEFKLFRIESGPLDDPPPDPPLSVRILAEYRDKADETRRKDEAETHEALAQMRQMLGKARLPAEVMKVMETEADPKKLYAALDGHLSSVLDALMKKYPDAAARIPRL